MALYSEKTPSEFNPVPESGISIEVFALICPTCGAKIFSSEPTKTEGCVFCGSPRELTVEPATVSPAGLYIPVSIDAQQCCESYQRQVRSFIYAPKKLLDISPQDFRCLYIPHNLSEIVVAGKYTIHCDKKRYKLTASYLDRYEARGTIHSRLKWSYHECSAVLHDAVGQAICPYDLKDLRALSPSFLDGAYLGDEDTPSDTYSRDARLNAIESLIAPLKTVSQQNSKHKYKVDSYSIPLSCSIEKSTIKALLPIWYAGRQYGDNSIVYAAVNGQTGRIYVDIPVDKVKYFLGTIAMTIPLTFLLHKASPVLSSQYLLYFMSFFEALFISVYHWELRNIMRERAQDSDRGHLDPKGKPIKQASFFGASLVAEMIKSDSLYEVLKVTVLGALISFFLLGQIHPMLGLGALTAFTAYVSYMAYKDQRRLPRSCRHGVVLLMNIVILIGSFILLMMNPDNQLLYQAALAIMLVPLIILSCCGVELHNAMSQKKRPNFNNKD